MRCLEPSEIMPFHATGKTFADARSNDVDMLSGDEVIGQNFRSYIKECIFADPEFRESALGLNLRPGEMATQPLGHALDLCRAPAELNRGIAILFGCAHVDDLNIVNLEDGYRQVHAVIGEHAGHTHFLRYKTGSHNRIPRA